MPRTKRLILRIGCWMSLVVCALLVLQSVGVVPPLGVGWGDGVRARGHDLWADGAINFRVASGMKQPTAGGLDFGVQTLGRLDVAGVHYHRWNMILEKPDRTPVPGDLGTYAEVRVAVGWPLLLMLAI